MQSRYLHACVAASLAICIAGCVDNDYDLSDIDTTTRVVVNDLTLPINIDAITIGDVITYEDDSKIQPITLDGEEFYALQEEGSFESDPINIDEVSAKAPTLSPTTETLRPVSKQRAMDINTDDLSVTFEIPSQGNSVSYDAGRVDDAIIALKAIKVHDLKIGVKLEALNLSTDIASITFNDVVIALPKGLTASPKIGSYNASTGEWAIPQINVQGNSTELSMTATAIDFAANGSSIDANHHFVLNSKFRAESGTMTVKPNIVNGIPKEIPEEIDLKISYTLGDMIATAFTGTINYKMDGFAIDPISLSDIPDFLDCEGTNLELANPQLYLQLNNPLAGNGLDFTASLKLTAERNNAPNVALSPEDVFRVGHNLGEAGPYNYVLAPSSAKLYTPSEYAANLNKVSFNTLGQILAAPAAAPESGLPDRIAVSVIDPQIPATDVTDFPLGQTINPVKGSYKMIAPLALTENSTIIYSDREDGWNDDTLNSLTISQLSISAKATNDTPIGVELYAWPIDVDGNKISGVEVKSNYLEPGATDEDIVIQLTGTVQHLDGVIYEARVKGSNSGKALSPGQTIQLNNIRVKVSGYYEDEL